MIEAEEEAVANEEGTGNEVFSAAGEESDGQAWN